MYPSRPAAAVATFLVLGSAAVMLAGCQSYQSKPLDLAAHARSSKAASPAQQLA